MSLEAIQPTTFASATTPTGTTGSELDKDAFLKLLVAQLRYQDPLNPAGSTEFMAQTAQFTMVEKLEELAATSAQMAASQQALAGSTLINRQVTWSDAAGVDHRGVVDGVVLTPSGVALRIDGDEVPLASLKEVHATES